MMFEAGNTVADVAVCIVAAGASHSAGVIHSPQRRLAGGPLVCTHLSKT